MLMPDCILEGKPQPMHALIEQGQAVKVRSLRGEVVFYAEVTDRMKQGVVHCFHGRNEANVNELTDDASLDPISGFPAFKSLLCQVALAH